MERGDINGEGAAMAKIVATMTEAIVESGHGQELLFHGVVDQRYMLMAAAYTVDAAITMSIDRAMQINRQIDDEDEQQDEAINRRN